MEGSMFYCGLCGHSIPHAGPGMAGWASHFRTVYSDAVTGQPRLSGVGYCPSVKGDGGESGVPDLVGMTDQYQYVVPAESHQRFDDADCAEMTSSDFPQQPGPLCLRLRSTRPLSDDWSPAMPMAAAERQSRHRENIWGFPFHESCWGLLEQACVPTGVDLAALWRVLVSVPSFGDLPDWGHMYVGLYVRITLGGGPRLIRPRTPPDLPSTCADPFHVPELMGAVEAARLVDNAAIEPLEKAISPAPRIRGAPVDPFATLPSEIRTMLLAYAETADAASLRLASRAVAAVPLTQYFFRSRFWPGRELEMLFDGFLDPQPTGLGKGKSRAIGPLGGSRLNWEALHRDARARVREGRLWLGERNRYRIWHETLMPLARALQGVARLGPLEDGDGRVTMTRWADQDGPPLPGWRTVRTVVSAKPRLFGRTRRPVHVAEVQLPPAGVRAVGVSLVEFFGQRYVTGLRFVCAASESEPSARDVEIGYIARHLETLLEVDDTLHGFRIAGTTCGFKGLAIITGDHKNSPYLAWAGDGGEPQSVTLTTGGKVLTKVKATFDVSTPPPPFIPFLKILSSEGVEIHRSLTIYRNFGCKPYSSLRDNRSEGV